jgi:hypothetical protein
MRRTSIGDEMKRALPVFGATIALLVFVATAAAASPQFKHGGDPTLTDNGSTLTLNAAMTGLGNGDLNVDIAWTGETRGNTCTSPGGNNAPGQNPATPASGNTPATISPDKNGNVKITLTTTAPTITALQAGCPNKNWSASYTDVVFFTATVSIAQASTSFSFSCAANFPSTGTTNGTTYTCS